MRLKQIVMPVVAMMMMVVPSTASSHELNKSRCAKYAAIHSLVVNPANPSSRVYRASRRRCVFAFRRHNLQHPLTNLPWIVRIIRGCESGGGNPNRYNYSAQNSVSTASGAYQYLDTTWGGHMGYKHAKSAPPRIQDMRALRDMRNSTSPWAASFGCWGPLR